VSGPCDEAEHANDPRCTGAAVQGDDDGADHTEQGEDDHSGRGGGGEDNSGHGGNDD
jgi:hypothetical protein